MNRVAWFPKVAMLASLASVAVAQAPTQTRTQAQEILTQATNAYNDLRYGDAIAIAQVVLNIAGLRRADRIEALQVLAASYYPDRESAQNRDKAIERLRQLVRIAPTTKIRQDLTWGGLDSLLENVRANTFGASVVPRAQYVLTGPDQQAQIDVVTTRAAQVTAWLEPETGSPIPLDSANVRFSGSLRFRILENGQPRIRSGAYRLVVSVADNFAPDTMRFAFAASIKAPMIDYVPPPAPLDSTKFLPEMTKPHRVQGIAAGIAVMAATIVASRIFRDGELRGSAAGDGRSIGLGIVLGAGTAGGVWFLDRGVPIPENIAANREARETYARKVSEAGSANAELLRSYRAELSLIAEEP
jgi:hypothetical protein